MFRAGVWWAAPAPLAAGCGPLWFFGGLVRDLFDDITPWSALLEGELEELDELTTPLDVLTVSQSFCYRWRVGSRKLSTACLLIVSMREPLTA